MKWFCALLIQIMFFSISVTAANKVLNVYSWDNYLSDGIISQFEKETGIKINLSVYDNSLTLYTKLKTRKNAGYDIIFPSSYFVAKMIREKMLHPLDKSKLKNIHHLDPLFLNLEFDPHNQYSLPFLWGTTGIAVNTKFINPDHIKSWTDLWRPEFKNKILLQNESQDVFTMGMLSLGYSVNDTNPEHIKKAYEKLKKLLPNVRLFNSMAIPNILIDEDINIAMVWSGEAYFATIENPDIRYIYPKEGFAIGLDNIAIVAGSEHLDSAYRFIDFMLRPEIAKEVTLYSSYATPNKTAKKLLPKNIRNNPIIFPNKKTLARGLYQVETETTHRLYNEYWQALKISSH